MPYARSGTHLLHYEVYGAANAPPLLLVMGLGFSSRAWDELPRRLAERFRVIVFDNRGVGRSTRPKGIFGIAHMADDAACVLDAAGVSSAHVFGISMGGMIALELVLRHPDRVRALALGCTYAGWLRSHKASLSATRDLFVAVARPGRSSFRRLARLLVSETHLERDRAGVAAWLGRIEHAGPLMAALQLTAVSKHATESRLAHIQAPTLVITGDADRLVPPENSRRLARQIRGARLVELRGAGHCFPVEQLDETARVLGDFFWEVELEDAADGGAD